MLPWTGIAVRKTFLISLGGFVMRKVIFTGLIFAFGVSICSLTASSADVAELLERAKKGEPEAQYGLTGSWGWKWVHATGARVMGIDPRKVPYLAEASGYLGWHDTRDVHPPKGRNDRFCKDRL